MEPTEIIAIIIFIGLLIYSRINKFQYLLKSPDHYVFDKHYLDTIVNTSNPLIQCIDDFCKANNVYTNGAIVSLSGGVDSMVTLAILIHLKQKHKFNIYTASIDYGLRNESHDESKFLEEYTKMFNIESTISYVKGVSRHNERGVKLWNWLFRKTNVVDCSRSEFEEESRNIRFDTYQQIINKHGLNPSCGVFVAHHMDDIVENIFTNCMRGANLLDLEVMKPISFVHKVKIFRPLLGFKKQAILDFAHQYKVPYFLDTTPKWSKRGLMRNEIFPLLDTVFGIDWHNKLKSLGAQSNVWGSYIDETILRPMGAKVTLGKNGVIIPISNNNTPKHIYSNIIMNALHAIGENMLKNNSINNIMDVIKQIQYKMITLDGGRIGITFGVIDTSEYCNPGDYLCIVDINRIDWSTVTYSKIPGSTTHNYFGLKCLINSYDSTPNICDVTCCPPFMKNFLIEHIKKASKDKGK